MPRLEEIYVHCSALAGKERWESLLSDTQDYREVPEKLKDNAGLPAYISELASIELLHHEVSTAFMPDRQDIAEAILNPTLRALNVSHTGLADVVNGEDTEPKPGEELVLVWRGPRTGTLYTRAAKGEDLLVMKMISEGITADEVARAGDVSVGSVERGVFAAADSGLVIMPPSKVKRPDDFPRGTLDGSRFFSAGTFTLQWHITQACDLHCTHCYDRSDRNPLPLDKALQLLEDFRAFCKARNVEGQVSFSGGNPLLYPHFHELYAKTAEYGFGAAIMGNPATREQVQRIIDIRMPSFFQISLEGLEEQNDAVRGQGHFRRSVEFLRLLKDMGISTMVMLTLTRDNIDDVIPLGLELEGLVDSYNFNRLAQVGEGASLMLPEPERFERFLREYLEVSRDHPHMRLKDNLFNILLHESGQPLKGGCTGFGCGAAFNFVSVLADGEVHACRKFPSRIGNVYEQGLGEIYDSALAGQYRRGCAACAACDIRPVCGGCLAVSHGLGMDGLKEKDRYCFFERQPAVQTQ